MLPHKEFKLITLLQGNNIVFLFFFLYSLFFSTLKFYRKLMSHFLKPIF